MSEQPAARVQAEAEDLRTPPPAYLEHPPATITPSALVQHETSEEPEIVGNTSVTQESLSAVPEKPLPTVPAEAYGGQTERGNAIQSPPPVQQPMKPYEARTAPHTITVTPLPQLTETPAWIDCPYCNQRTKTLVTSEGSSAQCMSAALCCLCCGIITVCVPFLCHWFEDTIIQCSSCKKQVAHIPHDGPIQVMGPTPQRQQQQQQPRKVALPQAPPADSPAMNVQ